jgi:predicted nucleic-acid-binding protein
MTHILLSHLSKENNTAELARQLFEEHAGDTSIIIASRNEATKIFTIGSSELKEKQLISPFLKPVQLGLF